MSKKEKIVSSEDLDTNMGITLFEGKPFSGICVDYHSNGKRRTESHYKNGRADGLWITWDVTGQISKNFRYENGEKFNGVHISFHENGQAKIESHYVSGQESGLRTTWDEEGNVTKTEAYKDGKLVK